MTYQETLDYMFAQLPMYQRIGAAAYKANLDNTIELDNLVGNPHKKFKSIHIAGTNGKGSTSHYLASILMEAGYKVGLYTSPHLVDYRERIRVNGEMIEEDYVVNFISNNKKHFERIKPSFFEMSVALAFRYFADKNTDIAIVETGLGGRLDSTNIITPILSIITNIGYDHVQFLGNTLKAIASEKAGIIKSDIPIIIGEYTNETKSVFEEKAFELNAPVYFAQESYEFSEKEISYKNGILSAIYKSKLNSFPKIESPLLGAYQFNNIRTVLTACEKLTSLSLSQLHIYNGIKNVVSNTHFEGRWQILQNQPLVICDIGHNEDGIKTNMEQLEHIEYQKLHLVIGVVNDKDVDTMLNLLPLKANYYYCRASIPRALDENLLGEKGISYNRKGEIFATVELAINTAKQNANTDDIIYIGGSAFVVADALVALKK